ncbi:hypothetical protein AVEN_169727-1 [Araneus ventricosus]|uniref:Uncharacterized protein n=1 Tax=Araneus ventricosus TaxID=182803 RepID=A0A4Y2QLH1_ARAVE|nr:hypothetical protein AVEN_117926-1 [Araneus ventricosus]GBN64137.1 hypothetical protein AVEN_169727-1 [Araneus ventricosus]
MSKKFLFGQILLHFGPVPHSSEISVTKPTEKPEDIAEDSEDEVQVYDKDLHGVSDSSEPQPFSQQELNYLVRDLDFSKYSADLLGSRLKKRNLLSPGTSFSWFRKRETVFTKYFSHDGGLVYRRNVPELMEIHNIQYDVNEWRLFIDLSKRCLKQRFCIMAASMLQCH